MTLEEYPDRAGLLSDLGLGYIDKYERSGVEADLEMAIRRCQEALDITLKDDPDRASHLHALSVGYGERFQRTGNLIDLEISLQRCQEAFDITSENNPERARQLHDLGCGYCDKYLRTGAQADLETAITRFQEALDMNPAGNNLERARQLQNLGAVYHDRYKRTGAQMDLETAIRRHQEALDIIPENHLERARQLHHLGLGYHDRYLRAGAQIDIETAIRRYQEAVDLTPENHQDRALRLQFLGNGYYGKYKRTKAQVDLETAIRQYQEAVNSTPQNHQSRASRIRSLGSGYYDKYLKTHAQVDLDTAIQQFQEALDVTLDGDPGRAYQLYCLGIGYSAKYSNTGAHLDLETAMQRYQEALDLTPADHPDRADRLQSLGIGYRDRYERLGALTDLEMAIQRFSESTEQLSSIPIERLRSAIQLSGLLADCKRWSLAYQAAYAGISLIPLAIPRFLENTDKRHLLSNVANFASHGTASALMAGKPAYEALQLLELGRDVISGALSELRSDVSDLQRDHPQMGEQYTKLREQLDTPIMVLDRMQQSPNETVNSHRSDQRYTAGREIEELIQDIRRLPGYERFLLAPSEDELKAIAAPGPVAVINASTHRCDALLIDETSVRVVPLSLLHADDINGHVRTLDSGTIDEQLLDWLWKTTAEPVLEALGFCAVPGESWPRIWWILVGPMARFPIHAAGCHSDGSGKNVLDRVISSYSSSIRSLARSRRDAADTQSLRMLKNSLLVGMPELSHTRREIDELEALFNATNVNVNEPDRLRQKVLAALDDCDIFHFAGHGRSDPLDPLQSALILSDGELRVSTLLETNIRDRHPFLAYLSACGTGRVKDNRLLDESLHLIAAFQLVGFRHVIGTLWEVDDRMCVDMAIAAYQGMQRKDMSDGSVSESLHHACRSLRNQWVQENTLRAAARRDLTARREHVSGEELHSNSSDLRAGRDIVPFDDVPLHWVPFVHFGI